MISFMLVQDSLLAVLVAAAVGFVVCMILHVFCPFKHWCQDQICCNKKDKAYDINGVPNDRNQKGCCDKDRCHENHGLMDHLCCKLAKFAVVFVNAYGIAFFLQRLDVTHNYVDAISVAIFLALVFVIAYLFLAVAKHKRHFLWFAYKTIHVLVVFSVIAAVLVYMASR